MSGRYNKRYQAFKKYFSDIVIAISSDVAAIANQAYSEGLISPAVRNNASNFATPSEMRASNLLEAIRCRAQLDHKALDIFLAILKEEPAHEYIARKIETAAKKSRRMDVSRRRRAALKRQKKRKIQLQYKKNRSLKERLYKKRTLFCKYYVVHNYYYCCCHQ